MDNETVFRIMLARRKSGKSFELSVTGRSMKPVLYKGDVITVQPQEEYSVGDILGTYVYRQGIEKFNYSYASGVGLFQNVIGFVLVLSANFLVKKTAGEEKAIW